MKKLLYILLMIPALTWGQSQPVTLQFRRPDPQVNSLDSIYYTFPGKVGGYSWFWNAAKIRDYVATHSAGYTFGNGLTNDGSGNIKLGGYLTDESTPLFSTLANANFSISLFPSGGDFSSQASWTVNGIQHAAFQNRPGGSNAGAVNVNASKSQLIVNRSDTVNVFELSNGILNDSNPSGDTTFSARFVDNIYHKGIKYSKVNRNYYDDSTLVDKGYVTSAIAAGAINPDSVLHPLKNFNDVPNKATARLNLGVYAKTEPVVHLLDSTKFATYSGVSAHVMLTDTLVGGGSLFVKMPKSGRKSNGGTLFASNSIDSLWVRQYSGTVNARWFGIVANGVADNSTALQRIAFFGQSIGNKIWFPAGAVKFSTTIQINNRDLSFEGAGDGRYLPSNGEYLSQFIFSGTGAAFQLGVDDGNPWDANEYNGVQGFQMRGFQLSTLKTTLLSNGVGTYTPGTYGIKDWRGGSILLDHVAIDGFEYGFWGVNSDINDFRNIRVIYCKNGMYIGPRSDQFTILNYYSFECDLSVKVDRAGSVRFIGAQIVGCGTNTIPSVDITQTTTSVYFDGTWWEHVQGYSGTDNLGFIRVGTTPGYGAITPSLGSASGIYCTNNNIINVNAGNAFHTQYFMICGNGTNVKIEGVQSPFGNALNFDYVVTNDVGIAYNFSNFDVSLNQAFTTAANRFLNRGTGSPLFSGLRGNGSFATTSAGDGLIVRYSDGSQALAVSSDASSNRIILGQNSLNAVLAYTTLIENMNTSGSGKIMSDQSGSTFYKKIFPVTNDEHWVKNTSLTSFTDNGSKIHIDGIQNGTGIGAPAALSLTPTLVQAVTGETLYNIDNSPTLGISTGGVLTFTLTNGGSAYTNGTYLGVPATGGSGTVPAYFDVTISGGAVTGLVLKRGGSSYTAGNTLSIASNNIGNTGTGLVIIVNTVGTYTGGDIKSEKFGKPITLVPSSNPINLVSGDLWNISGAPKWYDGTTTQQLAYVSNTLTNPMTTLGDVIYGGASGAPTRLAGNTATSRQFLTSTGNGTISAAPVYYDLLNTFNLWGASQTINGGSFGIRQTTIGSNGALSFLDPSAFSTSIVPENVTRTYSSTYVLRNLPDGSHGGTLAITDEVGEVNTTTIVLSSATLNSTYPNAIPGKKVICPSIIAGAAIYVKASGSTWLTIAATVTP